MPTYRIYYLDNGAHISKPPVIIECADDDEAKKQARQYIDGKDIELWREGTLVVQFPAKEAHSRKPKGIWSRRAEDKNGEDPRQ